MIDALVVYNWMEDNNATMYDVSIKFDIDIVVAYELVKRGSDEVALR